MSFHFQGNRISCIVFNCQLIRLIINFIILGMPPSMMRFPNSNTNSVAQATPNVVSAAPQLINRTSEDVGVEDQPTKSSATIEAKAKMRLLLYF